MAEGPDPAELQQVQRQLQAYDRHLVALEQNLSEVQTAIATLSGLSGDQPLSSRVPVGAGVSVAAAIDPTAPVLMDVGAGYATETTAKEALASLKERLQSVEAAFRTTSAEAQKLGDRMQALQMQGA